MVKYKQKLSGRKVESDVLYLSILMLLICFTALAGNRISGVALSGEYSVGGITSDFITLQDAISEINSNGISAPVQLLIEPGIYQVHVSVTDFQRFGSFNDILLIKSVDQLNPATLQWSASSEQDNWLIKLDETAFVAIRNLTLEATGNNDFANIIAIENGSSGIDIANNQFNNYFVNPFGDDQQANSIVSMAGSPVSNIQIRHNQFNSGSGAVNLSGTLTDNAFDISIENNLFTEQEGVGSFYVVNINKSRNVSLVNNVIENTTENSKGVYFFRTNDITIDANKIKMLGGGGGSVALKLNYNNDDGLSEGLVINNTLLASHKALTIGNISTGVKVYHNSILASDNITDLFDSYAVSISDDSTEVELKNNIIHSKAVHDLAFIMEIANLSALNQSNDNVFYGMSANKFLVAGTEYDSLPAYQVATGLDLNSLALLVAFVDEGSGDLHLNPTEYTNPSLVTQPVSDVIFDMDGDVRLPLAPLIGADELDSDLIFDHGFES